jgi:hypothetical protein
MRVVNLCGLTALFPCILVWGVGGVLTRVAPVALAAGIACAWLLFARLDGAGGPGERRALAGWSVYVAATGGSVVLGVILAGAASAGLVLLWVGALLATSPPLRRTARRALVSRQVVDQSRVPAVGEGVHRGDPVAAVMALRARGAGRPGAVTDADIAAVTDASYLVSTLATTELCQLWRTTFWMVRDATSPRRTACLVGLRQAALDELEQRHPVAVHQWLQSGHHAADGPARYL